MLDPATTGIFAVQFRSDAAAPGCGGGGDGRGDPVGVSSVTFNSAARTIEVGESFPVAATVTANGTLAKTATFTTSVVTIATVSSSDRPNAIVTGKLASRGRRPRACR